MENFNTQDGQKPTLDNPLLGLCPNCFLFGKSCSCGYNFGFPTGASFRRAKNLNIKKEGGNSK